MDVEIWTSGMVRAIVFEPFVDGPGTVGAAPSDPFSVNFDWAGLDKLIAELDATNLERVEVRVGANSDMSMPVFLRYLNSISSTWMATMKAREKLELCYGIRDDCDLITWKQFEVSDEPLPCW